ncbi:hypothetical protein VCHA53O466_140138 [Vibrio chagasii]|nr:hypothetical protein VCHA53O466_140138 [Vibrio chagasii]
MNNKCVKPTKLIDIKGKITVGKGEVSYLLPVVNNETFALSNVVIKLNIVAELGTQTLTIGVNCKDSVIDLTKQDITEAELLKELKSAISTTDHKTLSTIDLKSAVLEVIFVLNSLL